MAWTNASCSNHQNQCQHDLARRASEGERAFHLDAMPRLYSTSSPPRLRVGLVLNGGQRYVLRDLGMAFRR